MIEIVDISRIVDEELGLDYWHCWLELTQDSETWWLPAAAPGDLLESELQAHFETKENALWKAAQQKEYAPDLHEHLKAKRVLKAFAAVMLDEINILRGAAGLPERTEGQLRQAIKAKL